MEHALKQHLAGLSLSETQVDLLSSVEKFCRQTSPIETVRRLIKTETGFDQKTWDEIVSLGWAAITIPEHNDGIGLSIGDVVPVMEMMGRSLLNTPFLSTTLAAQAIVKGGDNAQKSNVLPQLVQGKIASLALSEPQGDYDLNNIQMRADAVEGGYALSGTKTLALDLAVSDYVIISATLNGETRLFLLETDLIPDGSIQRETLIDETKRSYAMTLEGLTLPQSALMPLDTTQTTLSHIHLCANLLYAAEMVGGTKACLDYTVEYLKTRKQFGRLIGSYQALKHPIVDAFVDYEKARSLLYSAASHCDNPNSAETAIRMAKVKADTSFAYAADRAIQFHGGFGFTYDCDAQLYRRRAIFDAAHFGGGRHHKGELARVLFGA